MKDAGMTDLSELETTPEVGDEKLGPAGAAKLIADFVDVLIPGQRLWPSASAVGVQGHLALRLMEERGKTALPTLVRAIEAAGGPLAELDEAACVAVVQRFEEAEPDLFGWVRDAVYIAYYENPFVAEAIVLSGHPYELRPHIKGYPVQRFDLARDTPRHGRGRYTKTADVRRVDISGLDLESDQTQAWGLKR
jgi:hypothetical protein